jgi:hypothetical protein
VTDDASGAQRDNQVLTDSPALTLPVVQMAEMEKATIVVTEAESRIMSYASPGVRMGVNPFRSSPLNFLTEMSSFLQARESATWRVAYEWRFMRGGLHWRMNGDPNSRFHSTFGSLLQGMGLTMLHPAELQEMLGCDRVVLGSSCQRTHSRVPRSCPCRQVAGWPGVCPRTISLVGAQNASHTGLLWGDHELREGL